MIELNQPYWATFSIFDFKTPRFRQALVLFDKIVVPIPTKPVKGSKGEITSEDLDRLSADVAYLEREDAAMEFKWDKQEFDQWRTSDSAEAMAQVLDRDRELATRLQLQESIEKSLREKKLITGQGHNSTAVTNATVVPVYAQVSDYQEAMRESFAEAQVIEIVSAELPMPEDNEPLESIIKLRQRVSFQVFMPAFRKWQEEVTLRLLRAGDDDVIRKREILAATRELRDAIVKFKRAVEEAKFAKIRKGITLPLVVGSAAFGHVQPLLAAAAEAGPELFNVRDLLRPWWRPLQVAEFALAGVICEAAQR